MKKSFFARIMVLVLAVSFLSGCGNPAKDASAQTAANPMQYLSITDLKADIDGGGNEYTILDVRKKEDYDAQHITGAITADVDAATKEGDDASGTANLKAALNAASGSETGKPDAKYVLVCYSGKSYAQKATDLLIALGVSKDNLYTLEGGSKAWAEAGDAYTALLE